MAIDLPQTFGKYVLLRKLAVGGMAEVFLAKAVGAEGFQRTVVIKRILPSYTEDEAFISMFIDEARIAAALHHAAIVQVIDFDKVDDAFYIAMEYIDGNDLRKILDRGSKVDKALTPIMVAHSIAKIASGLYYAHERKNDEGEPLNIIHRDVSPHNIMISFGGDVKLTDFGIAKAAARSTKTRAGTVKGKCAYMSPEQGKGKPLDPRADIFALCAVAWEMLTYRRLFEGTSDFEILNNVLNQSVPPPSLFRKSVPRELDAIVLKGLRKDPAERYSNMAALEKDLQNFVFRNASGREELDLSAYMADLYSESSPDSDADGTEKADTPVKGSKVGGVEKAADASSGRAASEKRTELLSDDVEPEQVVESEAATMAIDVSEGSPPTTVPVGKFKDELESAISDEMEAAGTGSRQDTKDTGENMGSPGADVFGSTGDLRVGDAGSHTEERRSQASRTVMWVFFMLVGVAIGIGGYYGFVTFGGSTVVVPEALEDDANGGLAGAIADESDTGHAVIVDAGISIGADVGTMVAAGEPDVPESDMTDARVPAHAIVEFVVTPRSTKLKIDGERVESKDGLLEVSDRFSIGDEIDVVASASDFRTHRKSYRIENDREVIKISLQRRHQTKPRPRQKPAEPEQTGFITINARPWADVYFNGKKIGTTPIRRMKVSVGRHVFTLRNKVASKSIMVNVDENRTTTRVVDM